MDERTISLLQVCIKIFFLSFFLSFSFWRMALFFSLLFFFSLVGLSVCEEGESEEGGGKGGLSP